MQDLNYFEASLETRWGRLIDGVDEVLFEDFSQDRKYQNFVFFGAT
jgi:hypothetical protein